MEHMTETGATPGQHEEAPAVLTTTEARGGETSGHVRLILASSLALALVAFLVLYGVSVG